MELPSKEKQVFTKLFLKRIQSELKLSRENNRSPDRQFLLFPDPTNVLQWYAIIDKYPDPPYKGGEYIIKLEITNRFPHKSPVIRVLTPNGRFCTQSTICISSSHYHDNENNMVWTLVAQIHGLMSMFDHFEPGIGALNEPDDIKKILASKSHNFNVANYPHILSQFQ